MVWKEEDRIQTIIKIISPFVLIVLFLPFAGFLRDFVLSPSYFIIVMVAFLVGSFFSVMAGLLHSGKVRIYYIARYLILTFLCWVIIVFLIFDSINKLS